jgi:hypothetical protein
VRANSASVMSATWSSSSRYSSCNKLAIAHGLQMSSGCKRNFFAFPPILRSEF